MLREARRQRWDAREPSQQRLSEPAAVCSLGANCHEALEALLGRWVIDRKWVRVRVRVRVRLLRPSWEGG